MRIHELLNLPSNSFAEADYLRGFLYLNGLGVTKDLAKAAFYFKSASKSLPTAQFVYGELLLKGEGVKKNEIHAIKLLAKAATKGCIPAAISLTAFYQSQGSFKKGFRWHKIASDLGCPASTHAAARCYEYGEGVKKNSQLSYKLYLKAASMGDYNACRKLSEIYSEGLLGQKVNKTLSKKFLTESRKLESLSDANVAHNIKQAAVSGHRDSQLFLGLLYDKGGFGLERNEKKSVLWIEKSKEFLDS